MYNPFFLFVGSLLVDVNPPKRQGIRLPVPSPFGRPQAAFFEHTRIVSAFFEYRSVG